MSAALEFSSGLSEMTRLHEHTCLLLLPVCRLIKDVSFVDKLTKTCRQESP